MEIKAFRLRRGDEIRDSIKQFIIRENITAATVISAVGCVDSVTLRMAGATPSNQDIRTYNGKFEIVSLIGNIGQDRIHLHTSLSDGEGKVFGGHLKRAVVDVTTEIVLGAAPTLRFTKEFDASTGFDELKIERI